MKVFLVGAFLKGSLEFSYERALNALGCLVRRFDLGQVNKILVPFWEHVINSKIYSAIDDFKPDLIFVIKGSYLWPKTIKRIQEQKKSLIFCFIGDNPLNLASSGSTNKNILGAIPYYDCYFIWTKSLIEPLVKYGAKNVRYLPFGFDPSSHHTVKLSDSENDLLGSDVVFVGNWDDEREHWLRGLTDFNLGLWGESYWGWRCKDKALRKRWRRMAVYGKDMCRVLSASKISINILRKQNKDNYNMRTFEAPACGAFVLAERSSEAKEFFEEDKEAVYFSSPQELKEKVRYYLKHEIRRIEISRAGYERCIKSGYSYLDRIKQILKVYYEKKETSASPKKYKLAIVASHVIQYAVPLYKKLNTHPNIEIMVFFCSKQGLNSEIRDPGFDLNFKWDAVNLEGLNYKFLKNYSPFSKSGSFFSLINPGIMNELKNNKYDAIIVGGYYLCTFWLAFLAAGITKTPFFLTGEPPTPWKNKFRIIVMGLIKWILIPPLLKAASAILYIGSKSKEYYFSYNKNIKNKLFFCPYSVDNDFYIQKAREYGADKDQIKKELGIPLGYPVILFLSKLIKWKRPMLLLEIYRELKIPAILIFVGSGKRFESLKKYSKRYGLNRVYFFGFQNYSQVPKFYSIADIFALLSLGESWGLAINEALCFGLPIVVTNRVMSAYDLVKEGVNGFIVEPDDKEGTLRALEHLLNNPEERHKMGKASSEIISLWNYDVWIKGLLEALRFVKNK